VKTKLIFSVFLLIFTFSFQSVNSQTLLTENFEYPVINNIVGLNGWVQGYAPNPANTIPVISPGLTFTGYPGSGIGNCILIKNDSAQSVCIKKIFTETTTGSIYAACMLRVDSLTASADQDFLTALDVGGSLSNFRCFLLLKKYNSNQFFLGVRKSSTDTFSPELFNKNQTYVVVTKYKFVAGSTTNDTVSLFVFSGSIPESEPAPIQTSATGNDGDSFGEIQVNNHAYGQFGSGLKKSSLKLDGIKIAKSWGEAVLIGIQNISSEVPSSFKLNQNYPNPFNPVTNIEFSIQKAGNIKLTVFDIQGKEVAQLFNGNLNAGSYKYDFDAGKLTSGVYFYKLQTEEFTDTKKMLLVK
jgi:hypothetical protein